MERGPEDLDELISQDELDVEEYRIFLDALEEEEVEDE